MSSLEDEGHALERLFNDAIPDYSPEIEWTSMSHSSDKEPRFVLEAAEYIDDNGIQALSDAGRKIEYVEAYHYDGETKVSIGLAVTGEVPE